MGTNSYKSAKQELYNYKIIRKTQIQGIQILKNINDNSLHYMREFTTTDRKDFDLKKQFLITRQRQLSSCQYLIKIQQILSSVEEQYCSSLFKIFLMFQYLERNLDDQINQRKLQQKKFEESEMWDVLAGCITALAFLQTIQIKHQALRSSSIFYRNGEIKICDPTIIGYQTNIDTFFSQSSPAHIYLSPEMAYSVLKEQSNPECNRYKGDVWTMGMIMLEMGLNQYQDECYRDDYTRVHFETVVFNLQRLRRRYSDELVSLVEFMLDRDDKIRPDWLQLQQKLFHESEKAVSLKISSGSVVSQSSHKSKKKGLDIASHRSIPIISETNKCIPAQQNDMDDVYKHITLQSHVHPLNQKRKQKQQQKLANIHEVAISDINYRPSHSQFPKDIYITLTQFDQNIQQVDSHSA